MAKTDGTADNRELSLPHLVKWVEMAVRARVERAMRAMPVSTSQLFALALLEERGVATAAELARMMKLTPQAMTSLLAPLREGGLIERRADSAHGRRLQMRLTAKGRRLMRKAHRLTPAIEAEILDGFTDAEQATLKALLARIARRFD